MVDGEEVGTIRQGARENLEISPGRHEVMLKIDWAQSQPLQLELAQSGRVELFCKPNANPITALYWITLGRKNYIGLRRAYIDDIPRPSS